MRAWLAVVAIVLLAIPAWADIDQHCLSTCVSNGKSGPDCLQQCSYNLPVKPVIIAPVTLQSLEVHRDFSAPQPAMNDLLPKVPKPIAPPEKDPVCVSNCLKQSLQYDYCAEHCLKIICPPGVISCPKQQNSFTGAATGR